MNIKNFEDNNMRRHKRGYSDIIMGEISIIITFTIKWRSKSKSNYIIYNFANCAGTKTIDLLPTASRRTNLIWQIRTEHHSPIVKNIKIQETHTYLGAAGRWVTFPEDKSIVRKHIIMQK